MTISHLRITGRANLKHVILLTFRASNSCDSDRSGTKESEAPGNISDE